MRLIISQRVRIIRGFPTYLFIPELNNKASIVNFLDVEQLSLAQIFWTMQSALDVVACFVLLRPRHLLLLKRVVRIRLDPRV